MSTDAAHEEGVGRIPPQCGPQDDGEATTEVAVQRLGLTPDGGRDGGDGFSGGGDLNIPPLEQISAIYCD